MVVPGNFRTIPRTLSLHNLPLEVAERVTSMASITQATVPQVSTQVMIWCNTLNIMVDSTMDILVICTSSNLEVLKGSVSINNIGPPANHL